MNFFHRRLEFQERRASPSQIFAMKNFLSVSCWRFFFYLRLYLDVNNKTEKFQRLISRRRPWLTQYSFCEIFVFGCAESARRRFCMQRHCCTHDIGAARLKVTTKSVKQAECGAPKRKLGDLPLLVWLLSRTLLVSDSQRCTHRRLSERIIIGFRLRWQMMFTQTQTRAAAFPRATCKHSPSGNRPARSLLKMDLRVFSANKHTPGVAIQSLWLRLGCCAFRQHNKERKLIAGWLEWELSNLFLFVSFLLEHKNIIQQVPVLSFFLLFFLRRIACCHRCESIQSGKKRVRWKFRSVIKHRLSQEDASHSDFGYRVTVELSLFVIQLGLCALTSWIKRL